MSWTTADTWIVVAGVLTAASCALLGNYLVLRRMSMMGDAISHAVLPGLAVAFVLTGSRANLPMFVGAAIVGVLTAVLTQSIHSLGQVEQSASMGVVFTLLFAVGLVLMERWARHVDLDPGCVLFGAIELVALDTTVRLAGLDVPWAVVTLAGMLAVNAGFVLLFYKELKISSFDPKLSTTLGINANLMHYLLMGLVAATSVACFPIVGSILVIAMLIVPPAAAHLLTDRLSTMIVLSVALAAASAALGHLGAVTVPGWFGFRDTSIAGMMAVAAGAILAIAILFAPRHGIVSRALHRVRLTLQVAREDALGLLYRVEEMPSPRPPVAARVIRQALTLGPLTAQAMLAGLARSGKIEWDGQGYRLTERGRDDARRMVRAHRLWESYLVQFMGLPPDHVHSTAMRLEHVTDPAMQRQLADRTDQPQRDPHGMSIPPAD
jgi:manganese/zinc/iron transport system permease protein